MVKPNHSRITSSVKFKIALLLYPVVMNRLPDCHYHISYAFLRTLVLFPTQDRPDYGAAAFKIQIVISD